MHRSSTPIVERARGHWDFILPRLGVSSTLLVNRHTECPVCGGKDRFRFDDKDGGGTWFCNRGHGTESENANGSAGNGFALVMDLHRCDFAEAAKLVEEVIGTDYTPAPRPRRKPSRSDPAHAHARAKQLWREAKALVEGDPADVYLRSRLGVYQPSRALRFNPNTQNGEQTMPALLSAYVDMHGDLTGLQRTFLTAEGRKIDGEARLTLGKLPEGGAVRLVRLGPNNKTIGIAEGVETAMSSTAMFGIPTWAALNAGRLQMWEPPEGITEVVIFGDNDANKQGQKAAYTLAARLELKSISTQVEIPPEVGTDWNDVHMGKAGPR